MIEDWRGVANLVDECLFCGKSDRPRPLPLVPLWGSKDSGQSELLDHLEACFQSNGPYVRWSPPGSLSTQRPYQVALLLALHLSEKVKRFGRLDFPMMIKIVGAAPGSRLHELVAETMLTAAEKISRSSEPRQPWHREELRKKAAVDALIALAKYEADNQSDKVDEILSRAHLVDLRDGCTTKLGSLRQSWDPLLIVAASSTRAPLASPATEKNSEKHWRLPAGDLARDTQNGSLTLNTEASAFRRCSSTGETS